MDSIKYVIPYVPVLDALDFSTHELLMEASALRLPIMTVNWPEQFPYKPITTVDLAYSTTGIYCRFWSKGIGLKASHTEDGSRVHEDSCVEFFLKLPHDSHYFNFEFNCIGTCDASHRKSREEATPLTKEQYATIRRASSERAGVIFDRPEGIHTFWVSAFIPFEILGLKFGTESFPDHILGNLYKCGDKTTAPHFASWMPVKADQPDFHRPECFQPLYFATHK